VKPIFRTTSEIVWLTLVFAGTMAGLYWALRYIGFSWAGALLLLTPVVLLGSLACIYGYYTGWKHHRSGGG
jgi:hypothetical protein